MFNKSLLLRAMLWSLAAAAAAGVLGVLLPHSSGVWKVVGTAVITSIACALMLGAARYAERAGSRRAGTFLMAVFFVEFLLSMAATWGLDLFLSNYQLQRILLAMGYVAMTMIPAAGFFGLTDKPRSGIAGWTGTIAAFVALGLMIIAEVLPAFNWWDTRLAGTGAFIGLYAIPAAIALIGVGRGDRRYWRWVGVLASAVACGIVLAAVWRDYEKLPGTLIAAMTGLAILVAHANLALLAPLTRGQARLRWATIAAVAVTAVLVDIQVYIGDGLDDSSTAARLTVAAGICAACGSVALAVMYRLNRAPSLRPTSPKELRDISLVCPMCKKKQTLPLNKDTACASCGLKIEVRAHEPRCATCGYLLYMLKSDRCPECGTPVTAPRFGDDDVAIPPAAPPPPLPLSPDSAAL